MLVVKGDFEKVKAEMKEAFKAKADEARALKKLHKKPYSVLVNQKLDEIEKIQNMYKVSKVLPVRYGGSIINFKAYTAFMVKIKGLPYTFYSSSGLGVEYRTGPDTKGWVEFSDLSRYFEGFEHIPVAEVASHE